MLIFILTIVLVWFTGPKRTCLSLSVWPHKVNSADGVMYGYGYSIDLSIRRGRQKRPLEVDRSSVDVYR